MNTTPDTSQHRGTDPLRPLKVVVEAVGSFWFARSRAMQMALVMVFLVVKNGFDIELRNIQEAYLPASQVFPAPQGYFSASFGQVSLTHVLGISTTTQWVAFHAVVTLVALVVIVVMAGRNTVVSAPMALLVVAAATASSGLLISLGKYDVFTVLGGFILALARTRTGAAVGAVIMISGNPEQAIVASLALVVLTFAADFRWLRVRAIIALLLSGAGWLCVQVWFMSNGMDSGRLYLIRVFIGESLGRFAASPELVVWSWLGAGWFVVIAALILIGRASRWPLLMSLIALPAVASIITADGARVFAAIVLPSFVAVGLWLASKKVDTSRYRSAAVGSFIILLVVTPTSLTGPGWLFNQVLGKFVALFAA